MNSIGRPTMKQAMIRSVLLTIALALSLFGAYGGEYDTRLNNYHNGRKLYNDAVITRSASAALDLGDLYIDRIKDYDKALYWYKKGYEFGDRIAAAYGVGSIYSDNLKDFQNALKWFKIAYDDGTIQGAYGLAMTYGEDLKDYPSAIKWYEIAHKGGDKDAAYTLGVLYGNQLKDYPSAIKWYETAYKGGFNGAAHALGLLYKYQLKDYENAKKWYKIAYKQGDYRGIQAMSVLYHDQYNDKITAGAYNLGLIGEYSKEDVINSLKSGWKLTDDDLKQAYKLHQTLDLPKHYTGGID